MEVLLKKSLPVLDTRCVLEEHLSAKLRPLLTNRNDIAEAVKDISNGLTNQDLIKLLEDEPSLRSALYQTEAYKREKEELGEELFCRVSSLEPDICAKITGMLLELDNASIRKILERDEFLLEAVKKSKYEYLKFAEECRLKEEAGEKIYDWMLKRYPPDTAAHLTGMLLELQVSELNDLLRNEKKLEDTGAMSTHQDLSNFIKKVHIDLRLSARDAGGEAAWKKHLNNSELLKKYATAMKELATTYWESNNSNDPEKNRIYWVLRECERFFNGNGQKAALDKELKMFKKHFEGDFTVETHPTVFPLKMLDVGSCYNPFRRFDLFAVTSIDIAPATEEVIQCDFLSAEVDSSSHLRRANFDVVLFSFFLEYLPLPKMRYDSCRKAFDLLKPGGILIILTPDSKHDTANSTVMKSWKLGLAHLGFIRVNYEKLKHLHCMTFYKCFISDVPVNWVSRLKPFESVSDESMVIPQDNNPYVDLTQNDDHLLEQSEKNHDNLIQCFAGLAGSDVFED